MASTVFFLDHRGKEIISRTYRSDVPRSSHMRFVNHIINVEEDSTIKPVFQDGPYHYCYIRHKDLYIVASTNKNANVMVIIKFLYVLVDVLKEYFNSLEEESIRDNFVLIYELLDEMMDHGYPQATESKILKEFINQEQANKVEPKAIPEAVTGVTQWRTPGIKYKKDEIFLDVIEAMNVIISPHGRMIHSEIVGKIVMKSRLSGMPELKLGLNDRVLMLAKGKRSAKSIDLEDVRFHQCVKLARFESSRTISFIPPDGKFEFMTYRVQAKSKKPVISVKCDVEKHKNSRIEYLVKATSNFRKRTAANRVRIKIPVPDDADSPKFRTSEGKVTYLAEESVMLWTISHFPGQKQYILRGHFGLPSIENEEGEKTTRAISVKFNIPYFTVSGMKIRYLKISEKSGYNALPWVRYITQGGEYQIRM
mmetsp:Transcript_20670/g.30929  ORF Transcript_20670/g.30929 Transcript_20670/m.30929 type:complete len:423 (-) Transcript_20670:53-1321(-)